MQIILPTQNDVVWNLLIWWYYLHLVIFPNFHCIGSVTNANLKRPGSPEASYWFSIKAGPLDRSQAKKEDSPLFEGFAYLVINIHCTHCSN